jgi:MoaA/NifB/PqqE/SkfB family radical SAM enzyme
MTAIRRVELNLGWACNNHCVFCGEQERRDRSREEGMFRIPAERIRDDLIRYRGEGYNHVTFLGGEPTIRKDIIDIVRFSRKLGFGNVFLTTNGRRFADRRFLRALLRAGLTDVCISIHGPSADVHDQLTDRPGSFAQMEQGLLNLVLEGQAFHTSSVITSTNAPHLKDLVHYLYGFRTLHMYMALPNPTGGAYRDFTRIYPRFSVVAPHVRAALEAAQALGQLVTVSKLPFCFLVGFEGYADDLFWSFAEKRHINAQIGTEDIGAPRIDQRFADRTATR